MASGPTIEPGYIGLDIPNKKVGFYTPVYEGDYEQVLASTVIVTVTQTITSAAGVTYTTATSTFLIVMTEGGMPCENL